MSRANSTEDLHVGDKEGQAGEAAAALGKEPLKKTTTKEEEEEEHDLLRGQLYGRWGTAAAPQHPTLSPDDKPLMDAAASPLFLKVYRSLDEQQRQDTQTEQTAPAASGLSGKVSSRVEVLALKSDEVEGRLDDNGLYGAPASPSSSCSPSASFSLSSFLSSSACARTNYEEQKSNGVRRVMSNSSPSSHRRVWLCRIRSATSSVCGKCGTPFEICVRGGRNYLGRTPCPALPNNPSDLTPTVLHAELTHNVPAIGETRNGEPVQSSGATIPAAGKRAAAGSCVPATAVSTRGALAPSATATTVEDDAYDYGNGSRYDASGSHSEINCKFSPNASTYSNYSRLAKQQRLPVLQLGDGHGKRRLSTQPLPVARVALFCRPCHNPQEDGPAEGCGATYCLLGKGGRKDSADIDGEESKREGGPPQEKLHDLFGASVPPEDGDVGTAKCDEAFADCAPSYEAYSSSSLASSSSCSVLSSSSASSASPAPAPSATSATASSTSGTRRFNSKAERRRADSRRDRCRSVSSTRGSSSVERATLTRTGSNSCTNSTCVNSTGGSRPGTRFCGRRYFYYCCASYLGFTWGWTFQRQPPATWRDYVGELKCGVAVALSQLPATMTCAIVANVPVTSALHGAWITGLITAIFGGSPSSVTTVTCSLAVTLAKVTRTVCDEKTNTCTDEGLEFIFPALILAGACCLLLGTLRLSRFSQFVPSATIVGYLNAVAILNVKAQVVTLKFDPVTSTGYEWLWVLLMITTVFVIMCTWENIPKIRINALVPASVLALAVSSFIEFVLVRGVCGMQTKTVAALSNLTNKDEGGDTKEHIQGDASSMWPKPFFRTPSNVQPFNFYFRLQDLLTMLELTLALVMVNYMSTLVTLDMLSDKSSHLHLDSKPDQHLVSVGFANIVACFLGALPGSTAPFPSLLSLKLGSKSREGAVIAALVNLAFVAASPYFLDLVPLGGLAGIIMYTAYHAFQWRTVAAVFASFLPERLRMKHPVLQRKICRSDAFVMLLTTSVALCVDIGTAILSGVCIASCVFAWKNAARLQVLSRLDVEAGVKFYRVKGPIFFLTKRRLLRYFDVEKDPVSVILELSDEAEQLFDYGALETLDALVMRYRRANKRLKVVGMQCGDRKMIVKAGRLFEFAQIELVEKPLGDSASVKSIADMMKLPC